MGEARLLGRRRFLGTVSPGDHRIGQATEEGSAGRRGAVQPVSKDTWFVLLSLPVESNVGQQARRSIDHLANIGGCGLVRNILDVLAHGHQGIGETGGQDLPGGCFVFRCRTAGQLGDDLSQVMDCVVRLITFFLGFHPGHADSRLDLLVEADRRFHALVGDNLQQDLGWTSLDCPFAIFQQRGVNLG